MRVLNQIDKASFRKLYWFYCQKLRKNLLNSFLYSLIGLWFGAGGLTSGMVIFYLKKGGMVNWENTFEVIFFIACIQSAIMWFFTGNQVGKIVGKKARNTDKQVLTLASPCRRETMMLAKTAALFTYYFVFNFLVLLLILFIFLLTLNNFSFLVGMACLLFNGLLLALTSSFLIVGFTLYSRETASWLIIILSILLYTIFSVVLGFLLSEYRLLYFSLFPPLNSVLGGMFYFFYWKHFLKKDLGN